MTPPIEQVVVFAGAVRPTPLLRAAGRNVLDLPLFEGQSVGQRWVQAHHALAEWQGSMPTMRVLIDRGSPRPSSLPSEGVSVEPDDVAFLGTGGILRAAAQGCTGRMLVLTGGSVLAGHPLAELVQRLAALEADVALLAEHDKTPTGLMLVRAPVLAGLPRAGYLDFKEQCLPRIAQQHRVQVSVLPGPGRACLPIRNREQYLAALEHLHGSDRFALIEPGAQVADSARLREAVVLAGAQVGPRAVVARSVLGPGSSVPAGGVLTDRALGGSG